MLDFITAIGRNLALLFTLTFAYGLILSRLKFLNPLLYRFAVGLLFGVMGIFAMLTRIPLAPGIFTDGRDLFIALACVSTGPFSGIVAGILIIIARLLLGGVGAYAGMGVAATAILAGIVAHLYLKKPISQASPRFFIGLGAILSLLGRLWVLTLPDKQVALSILQTTTLPLLLLSMLECLLLGYLLAREVRRLEIEAALVESELRFSIAFRASPVSISINTMAEGRYVDVNESFLSLYGFTREEVIGHTVDDLNFFINPDERKQILESLKLTPMIYQKETEIRTKLGEIRTVLISIDQIVLGGIPHMLALAFDITNRKQAEAAIREQHLLKIALEKESELNAIKSNIMRTISHEFRTPLTVIQSAHNSLRRYIDKMSPQQRQEKLESIEMQVNQLNSLVGEISAVVHELSEKYVFQPKDTDLDLLCQTSFTELQTTIGSHHKMSYVHNGNLHATFVDERLIRRILTNLLSNAIKYSPEGSEITLKLDQDGDKAVIQVVDHGIGIVQDDQKRLFEPFFRASNVGQINGTGLGLNIVRDCVKLHQGQITFQSEPNQGTTFTVRLPVKARSAEFKV